MNLPAASGEVLWIVNAFCNDASVGELNSDRLKFCGYDLKSKMNAGR